MNARPFDMREDNALENDDTPMIEDLMTEEVLNGLVPEADPPSEHNVVGNYR